MKQDANRYYVDMWENKDGTLKVFLRKGSSKNYYAKFKLRNYRTRKNEIFLESLGTPIRDDAVEEAMERYFLYKHKLKNGVSINRKTFKEITDALLERMLKEVERGEIKEKKRHDYQLVIDRYLNPYFGDKLVNELTNTDIEKYRLWRKNYWSYGDGKSIKFKKYIRNGKVVKQKITPAMRNRVPSNSTRRSEESILRQVLKFAVTLGVVLPNELPKITSTKSASNRRSTFTEQEYRRLRETAQKRITEAKRKDTFENRRVYSARFIFFQYILIAANTGARVTELMGVKWNNVIWNAKTRKGKEVLQIRVTGKKQDYRVLTAQDTVRTYLNRLLEHQQENAKMYGHAFSADEEFIFSDYKGRRIKSFKRQFEECMELADVTYEKGTGKRRSLGSLRSFYATIRASRAKDMSPAELAHQLGTSVQLVDKHYYQGADEVVADAVTS